jgi:hypothetical protein
MAAKLTVGSCVWFCRDAYGREGRSKLPGHVAPATHNPARPPRRTRPGRCLTPPGVWHRTVRLTSPFDGYVRGSVICVSNHKGSNTGKTPGLKIEVFR